MQDMHAFCRFVSLLATVEATGAGVHLYVERGPLLSDDGRKAL